MLPMVEASRAGDSFIVADQAASRKEAHANESPAIESGVEASKGLEEKLKRRANAHDEEG
jgi:hypothetical protein